MVSLNKVVRAFTHEGARGKRLTPEMELKRALMNCLLWEDQIASRRWCQRSRPSVRPSLPSRRARR
jgi:hypothetical protein